MREVREKTIINNIGQLNSYIGGKYEVEFNNAVIKCPFSLFKSTVKKITFKDVVFQENVFFNECIHFSELTFNGVIFRKQFGMIRSKVREKFHIIEAQFDKDLTLSRVCSGEIYFENIVMKEKFTITVMYCFGLNTYRNIRTPEFHLVNINAKQQVNISKLNIENDGDIHVKTRENISFTNSEFGGNLQFSAIANKELHLHQLRVGNVFSFSNSKAHHLWMNNIIIVGSSFLTNNSFKNASREANRFFKNELIRINNKIDALEYQKQEMIAFLKELINSFNFKKIESYKSISDMIIVGVSWLSNGFGLYYLPALFWYLILSFLILVGISDYEFTTNLNWGLIKEPEFWYFLNPTHKLSQISGIVNEKSAVVVASNLFARIVQGFLIYQFIKAFRKFSFR